MCIARGITTAPADPAMQGGPWTQGAQAGCPKIFSSLQDPALFHVFMAVHCLDEFVGIDPLDRARFARNVLDFLACWHVIF